MESTRERTHNGGEPAPRGSAERREQLLEVGRRHFLTRPYDEVSLDEIAAEAGVSHGLVFHYFDTKRGFYVAALRSFLERRPADAHRDESLTARERLVAGLEEHLALVDDQGANYQLLMHGGPGADDEALRMFEEFRRRGMRRVLDALGVAEPSPQLRIALRGWIGFMEGAIGDWLTNERDLDRKELVALLADALADVLARYPE